MDIVAVRDETESDGSVQAELVHRWAEELEDLFGTVRIVLTLRGRREGEPLLEERGVCS